MQEDISATAEKQAKGQIEGVVFEIAEKANTTELHLKECIFYDEAEGKTYPVGNILVYYSKKSNQKLSQSLNQTNKNQKINIYIVQKSNKEQCEMQSVNKNGAINANIAVEKETETFKIGNRIRVSGSLESFQLPRNPGQFNERFYYRSRQYYYKFFGEEIVILDASVWKILEILRDLRKKLVSVYDAHLVSKEAGVIKAMVLGEKSGLLEEIKTLYQQNGIGHLMAISGLHISLFGRGFYRILEKLGSPKKVSSVLAISVMWLYGLMTGFSISANRAVVMLMLSFAAGIVGRTYDMATALSVSGCIILIQKPMLCFDCGFLLSFGSIIGIGFFYPLLENVAELKKTKKQKGTVKKTTIDLIQHVIINKIVNPILKSLLASLSVQFVTLPIILYFYFEIPVYGVFLNILVIPFMSILLSLSILGGVAGLLFPKIPFLPRFFLGSVHMILNFYEICGETFGSLPYSQVIVGKPQIWQIILYYGVLACIGAILFIMVHRENKIGIFLYGKKENEKSFGDFWFIRKNISDKSDYILQKLWIAWKKSSGWWKCGICLLLLCSAAFLLIPADKWSTKELEMTFLDVGQGDCIFLKNGNGMTCLIDGGSTDEKSVGTYRIMPFLKSKGVGSLDYVIVTHTDSDHINGIVELLEKNKEGGIKINYLVLPKTTLIEENYEKLINLAEKNKIPIIYIKEGDSFREGNLEMICLHPAPDFVPENVNSYSTLLQVEYGGFKALLTGDLEGNGEEVLLERGKLEDIFLLKVAHHGSKNSTSEKFLEKVNPELAIISYGENNSYGHPHAQTLERLKSVRSKIMSTADHGGITIEIDKERVKVYGYIKKETSKLS